MKPKTGKNGAIKREEKMYCSICKKDNLETKEINRLVTKDNEEIIICDECIKNYAYNDANFDTM